MELPQLLPPASYSKAEDYPDPTIYILLQETRSTPQIPGYITHVNPSIAPTTRNQRIMPPPGYVAVLVRSSLGNQQIQDPEFSSADHEVVAVHTRLPGGKPIIVATAYYKPTTSSSTTASFTWLQVLTSRFPGTPILLGGDFNAPNTLWGYNRTHPRGKALEYAAEAAGLHLINDPDAITRIGLHAAQRDTSPDLTWATAGLVQAWTPYATTWGSDHLPILIKLRSKTVRSAKAVTRADWNKFRHIILTSNPPASLDEFCNLIATSSAQAQETIQCRDDTRHMDNHLANLWRRVHELTRTYRVRGKRHRDLQQIRRQYRLISDYQRQLNQDSWATMCSDLSHERGLSGLWKLHRKLSGKSKGRKPLFETLTLTAPASDVEKRLITTFFPTASTLPPPPLPIIPIDNPDSELDSPFTMAELRTAIRLGRQQSAPGHDNVTWKHLCNLPPEALPHLLTQINSLWEQGLVPDHLKLTLIFPIPKPKKTADNLQNLRPISLTPVLCKLIERLINIRIIHHLEYVRPYFHPAQTGFRPNLGTHDSLWLLRRVMNRPHYNRGDPDLVMAIDLRKAFDNVSQAVILEELAKAYPQQSPNLDSQFLAKPPHTTAGVSSGMGSSHLLPG